MRILFCTDGSDSSFYSLKKACQYIQKANIDIITAIDWGMFPTYTTFPREEFYNLPRKEAEETLEKAEKFSQNLGLNVVTKDFYYGAPVDIIMQAISKGYFDLVIMGSHGRHGFKNWLGSVSRKVVSKSLTPVFISKYYEKSSDEKTNKVLIAVDGSNCSYNAIYKAFDIFKFKDTHFDILNVQLGKMGLPLEVIANQEWLEESLDKQYHLSVEIITRAQSIIEQYNLSSSQVIKDGNLAQSILDYAKENNFDFMIMGSHGREGLSDFILGSISKRVLDYASIPVFVVPLKSNIVKSEK